MLYNKSSPNNSDKKEFLKYNQNQKSVQLFNTAMAKEPLDCSL